MNRPLSALVSSVLAVWSMPNAQAQPNQEYQPVIKVAPLYPDSALADGLEGYVIVEYTVTARGTVEDAIVVESSDNVFEVAALDSIRKFKYRPRIIEGQPVSVPRVRSIIRFTLPKER